MAIVETSAGTNLTTAFVANQFQLYNNRHLPPNASVAVYRDYAMGQTTASVRWQETRVYSEVTTAQWDSIAVSDVGSGTMTTQEYGWRLVVDDEALVYGNDHLTAGLRTEFANFYFNSRATFGAIDAMDVMFKRGRLKGAEYKADRRARSLFRDLIGVRAYRRFLRKDYHEVDGPDGKRFRFRLNDRVEVVEKGAVKERWCIVPDGKGPILNAVDQLISKMMYVLSGPEEARKIANVAIVAA